MNETKPVRWTYDAKPEPGEAGTVVWQQMTTGVIHRRPTCSVARRSTRYTPVQVRVTAAQLAAMRKCGKCWS